MDKSAIERELESIEYKEEWKRHQVINRSLLMCLSFCMMDFGRAPQLSHRNFFTRMAYDIIQSCISIEALAEDGIRNSCRRELRYLLELSIKACFISREYLDENFTEQVEKYEKLLKSTNINIINKIELFFFTEERTSEFRAEAKRTYGALSNYVHLTPHQIYESLALFEAGRHMGFEGVKELTELNSELERTYDLVLTLFLHSIPSNFVGDFMVDRNIDGRLVGWHFSKSKYLADIDSYFDYKHERQEFLEEIRDTRTRNIAF